MSRAYHLGAPFELLRGALNLAKFDVSGLCAGARERLYCAQKKLILAEHHVFRQNWKFQLRNHRGFYNRAVTAKVVISLLIAGYHPRV